MNIKDWPGIVFISGIDTDAGKSYATGWLARKLMDTGMNVITQKFVQTGNLDFSEDIVIHRRLMKIENTSFDLTHLTAPVIFSYPASPDLAAKIDDKTFDPLLSLSAAENLAKLHDTVLIEGAGGLMVPLHDEYLAIDFIKEHNLPLILVTNSRLGSINHTLLSFNAIKSYGIPLLGVIYNSHFDTDSLIAADTKQYIRKWMANHFRDSFFMEMPSL